MTTREYDEELQSEQQHVSDLYRRLDAERARVRESYAAALRSPIDKKDGGTLVQRDSEVRALAKEMRRLDVADTGLCFGRLDAVSGERSYIGKGAGCFRGVITHAANRFDAPMKTTFPPRICGSTGPDPQVRY